MGPRSWVFGTVDVVFASAQLVVGQKLPEEAIIEFGPFALHVHVGLVSLFGLVFEKFTRHDECRARSGLRCKVHFDFELVLKVKYCKKIIN